MIDKNIEKLEELRKLYREERYWEFNRCFWLNAIYLNKEDRDNVYKALKKLGPDKIKIPDKIQEAINILGGKLTN